MPRCRKADNVAYVVFRPIATSCYVKSRDDAKSVYAAIYEEERKENGSLSRAWGENLLSL